MTRLGNSISYVPGSTPENREIIPAFWNELQAFLESLIGPVFNPIIDAMRDESFRSLVLSTIIVISLFIAGVVYVIHEVPTILGWIAGGMNLSSLDSTSPSSKKRVSPRQPASSSPHRLERPEKEPVSEKIHGVHVEPIIEKHRDEVVLSVKVTNNSEHRIEMVVVDIDLPEGIDIMTGSFRMQRIGTIEAGNFSTAIFKLRYNRGSLSDIKGEIEFMSPTHDITQVSMPSPVIEGTQ